MASGPSVSLACHPAARCPAVESIVATVAWGPEGLGLRYLITGRIAELAIPAEVPPGFADGLWNHACCEAFVAPSGEAAYREFNFSPSGQWAAYAFSGYRRRDESCVPPAAPVICCRRASETLELEARLPAILLPAGASLELGLTAVIESRDGTRSYWALAHGNGRPDFHRRDTFRFALDTNTP